ncbi:MotA/TolQ/ExbB proton channel family protein [Carboxylicivirga caseinilyticus]|uniref:MotA/TolQ/ExbB proton channel family protein n=1 Tax=Carboxylicivirga caseinilyticus TaxID=3417572 RepID=UPI003D33BE82|nr:MotA/TolQ/ExbB proton channel family protein [Marinilabiliaceae bacterium A049]
MDQLLSNQYNLITMALGFVILIVGYIMLIKIRQSDRPNKVPIFWIWLLGLVTLLFGILGQVMSIASTFDTITMMGTISASIVAEGIKDSYQSTITGLWVLIISLIIWGVLKNVQQKRL